VGNLLENAIGHTKEGGRVRLSVERGDGDRVSFAVEDDGPGIPAEQRERIFDRFHRTDVSRARSSGGTGLGLAIVRAIVVAHGGEVRAGSAAGGGARVEFELPGFRVQAPEGQPETGSVPAP
jgi:signal transduction histidine kinase